MKTVQVKSNSTSNVVRILFLSVIVFTILAESQAAPWEGMNIFSFLGFTTKKALERGIVLQSKTPGILPGHGINGGGTNNNNIAKPLASMSMSGAGNGGNRLKFRVPPRSIGRK